MRPLRLLRRIWTHYVSIHAPWEGCDGWTVLALRPHRCFNSRTLGRVRHKTACDELHGEFSFNSRTLGRVRLSSNLRRIASPVFQFTHPGKGATVLLHIGVAEMCVSIHAPWEGCDYRQSTRALQAGVSIHAPWEGCDEQLSLCRLDKRRFNSRTLGRVRPRVD